MYIILNVYNIKIVNNIISANAKVYFQRLAGKRLSSTRLTPHVAAPPITPPATAFPTNTAPATTIGAILASGAVVANDNDDDDECEFI